MKDVKEQPDVMVRGKSLHILADRLCQIADELRQGKWPKASAVFWDNHLHISLDGKGESQ